MHLVASEITVSKTASKSNMCIILLKKLTLSKECFTPDYARQYIFLGHIQRYQKKTNSVLLNAVTQEIRGMGSLLLYTRYCEGAICSWKNQK